MIRLINRPVSLSCLFLVLSSKRQIQVQRSAAVDRINPYQGIVTVTGLVGALSTPELSTLSTM